MTDRARHIVERQTTQAMTTLGRTVRDMLNQGHDPTWLLAHVQRGCDAAQANLDAGRTVPSGPPARIAEGDRPPAGMVPR